MPDIYVGKNSKETKEHEQTAQVHDKKVLKTNQNEIKHSSKTSSNEPQVSQEAQETKEMDSKQKESEQAVSLPHPATPEEKHALLHDLGIKEHGGSVHAFSSYFEAPKKVKFANELDEEILLLFLRQHFVVNIPWIIKAIALGLIPVLFEFLAAFGFYSTGFADITSKFILYFFYYFFIFSGYVFVNYMTWFYNISLVTNLRVVDIDFSDIVFENVAATKFPQLEDVSYSQIGIIRSLFDYGDVFVQTAGTARNFEFMAVPHPENVIRIINSLLGKKRYD